MKGDFLKKVQGAATKVAESAGKKVEEAKEYLECKKEIIKLKLELVEEKSNLEKCYAAYGKLYYHGQPEPGDAEIVKQEIESILANIEDVEAKLAALKEDAAAMSETEEQAEVTAFCTKCGSKREDDDVYCGKCGKKY